MKSNKYKHNDKCSSFCNVHCSCNDCPSIQADMFEDRFDLPASEIGLERIDCKDCEYNDKLCGCEDCYFDGSKDCERVKMK